ncbi:hypothetical protein [Peribacillus glennii]|uniref:Uncharacterized protein n=1 Tax=Peribacillus glennii TaxID=2303991 RepID=A0A372L814_9BACI|nr:hypothetical protein [Peribacillus glennii]RFU61437.1 hypothetical protein D0466_18315 [Peribacillus glennii]
MEENTNSKQDREYYEKLTDKTNFLKNDYYTLKQGSGYTSPPSSMPAHELKMLKEYIHGINLKQLGLSLPDRKKTMLLMRFLKGKRNQQVNVHAKVGDKVIDISGRVSVVGRDFVAVTTISERYWFPYSAIESASVPYGVPDMPNNHQQVVYDETLRRKLLTEFSTTVLKQDVLKRQFYEESLEIHLQSWKGTKVRVYTKDAEFKGKVKDTAAGGLTVANGKSQVNINLAEIQLIKRSTPFQLLSSFGLWLKDIFKGISRR